MLPISHLALYKGEVARKIRWGANLKFILQFNCFRLKIAPLEVAHECEWQPKKPEIIKPTSKIEKELCNAANTGGWLSVVPWAKEEKIVSSKFFRALLNNEITGVRLHEKGLGTKGLIFNEKLDLSFLGDENEPIPRLYLHNSILEHGVDFSYSCFMALSLDDAKIGEKNSEADFFAQGMIIKNTLFANRIKVFGTFDLLRAKIDGQLQLIAAYINSTKNYAIVLQSAKIGAAVLLNNENKNYSDIKGGINASGATIDGQFALTGAKLIGNRNEAFLADNMQVGSFFANGDKVGETEIRFEAKGEFSLLGAQIHGGLYVYGADFINENGNALILQDLKCQNLLFDGYGNKNSPSLIKGKIRGHNMIIIDVLHIKIAKESFGQIWLDNSKCNNIHSFNPEDWGAKPDGEKGVKLSLDGFAYDHINFSDDLYTPNGKKPFAEAIINWLERQFIDENPNANDFTPRPYEQASRTLAAMGHVLDADEIRKEKRHFQIKCKIDNWLVRFFRRLFGFFFEFGYSPQRAAFWGSVIAFIWSLTVWYMIDHNILIEHNSIAAGANMAQATIQKCQSVPALWALDSFIPVIDLQEQAKCEIATKASSFWDFLVDFVQLIGAVFVPLMALTFSGVLRRD